MLEANYITMNKSCFYLVRQSLLKFMSETLTVINHADYLRKLGAWR